jgi:voltage-gated potassium channel
VVISRGRAAVYRQLEPRAWDGRGLSPLNKVIVAIILLATVAGIVETEPAIYQRWHFVFDATELLFGVLFAVEYVARFWSVAEDRGRHSALRRRGRYLISPAALVDLAVIVLTLVPVLGINAAVLRLVRLLRIARLAKLGRTSTALRRLGRAVWLRRYELGLTLVIALGVLLVGATVLYWLEGEVQPEQFGSVPRSLWWAVTTLTTIGYGDAYPVTATGKVAASVLALASVGLIALPAGIMAGAMHEVIRPSMERENKGQG